MEKKDLMAYDLGFGTGEQMLTTLNGAYLNGARVTVEIQPSAEIDPVRFTAKLPKKESDSNEL
jgi:hypothetical protein